MHTPDDERAGVMGAMFTAALTHTIRSRLNAVLGSLELINQAVLPARDKNLIATALKEGRALLSLSNDALDMGRIEAGELTLDIALIDPVAIAEAALGAVAMTGASKAVAMACTIDPQTPVRVLGDGLRLRQLLQNLLDFARSEPSSESVQLKIRPHPEDLSGSRILFEIVIGHVQRLQGGQQDASQSRAHLFDPLVPDRAQARIASEGLSMALTRQFVTLMDGNIEYREGRVSSTIHFDVKFELSSESERLADRIAPVRNLRVLLIDSDNGRRLAFANQGRTWGMRTVVAPDAERARAALSKGQEFDLVLLHQNVDRAGELASELSAASSSENGSQRTAILVPLGAGIQPELYALAKPSAHLQWVSEPMRSQALISLLLDRKLTPLDCPELPLDSTKRSAVRILLIEDSEANRLVMRSQLEQLGCNVETAETGMMALRLVAQRQFDLVLTDLSLPDMSGLEVASRIRKLPGKSARVAIVAVTGGIHPQDRQRCFAAGMNGYLTKPVAKKDLHEVLSRYVLQAQLAGFNVALLREADDETAQHLKPDVLVVFERELSQRLDRISKSKDPKHIAQEAHALKSTAGTLGATELSSLAKQLERLCLDGSGVEIWQPCRMQMLKIGLQTLNEISDWLDAENGGPRNIN